MKYLKSFTISRPLLFLCGPAIPREETAHKKDRRVILSKAIYNLRDKEFHPLPIVVDDLFSDEPEKNISNNNLNVGLLEEIVANLSYRTYIFLDTMSTSYELGLFSNSKQRNNVVILLDDEFRQRINCSVGEYITKATESRVSTFIQYPGIYNGRGHLFFKDDALPSAIQTDINQCLNEFRKSNVYSISFSKGFLKKQETGNIQYELKSEENTLVFKLGFKTLFYLLCATYTPSEYESFRPKVEDQVKDLTSLILSSFINLSKDSEVISKLYFGNLNVEFFDYDYQVTDIISNMKFIIYQMKTKKVTHIPSTILLPSEAKDFSFNYSLPIFNAIDSKCFFGINEKEYKVLENYSRHPDKYIYSFPLRFKKKQRLIKTYKDTKCGKSLKNIHQKIYEQLRHFLPTSSCSFAYKPGKNTKKCLEKHMESNYFLKLDIHDFFNSVSKRQLLKKILMLQRDLISSFQEKYRISSYWSIFNYDKKIIGTILNGMMINRTLPIGFVTSPILSDYYLFDSLDQNLSNADFIYTRYADDILISSTEPLPFARAKSEVERLLCGDSLALNDKKTRCYHLKNIGDSIKFLGLVLVKTEKGNVIKVSKSYLIKVSQLISRHYNGLKTKSEWLDKLDGMVCYIRFISWQSYEQLKKIYQSHNKGKANNYFGDGFLKTVI